MAGGNDELFRVEGKRVVITGGAGVLCREMATALARAGAGVHHPLRSCQGNGGLPVHRAGNRR